MQLLNRHSRSPTQLAAGSETVFVNTRFDHTPFDCISPHAENILQKLGSHPCAARIAPRTEKTNQKPKHTATFWANCTVHGK